YLRLQSLKHTNYRINRRAVSAALKLGDLGFLHANKFTQLFLRQVAFPPCCLYHLPKNVHAKFVLILVSCLSSSFADVLVLHLCKCTYLHFLCHTNLLFRFAFEITLSYPNSPVNFVLGNLVYFLNKSVRCYEPGIFISK